MYDGDACLRHVLSHKLAGHPQQMALVKFALHDVGPRTRLLSPAPVFDSASRCHEDRRYGAETRIRLSARYNLNTLHSSHFHITHQKATLFSTLLSDPS